MPPRLPTPASRSLETAQPLVHLPQQIRIGSLLRRGVTKLKEDPYSVSHYLRPSTGAVRLRQPIHRGSLVRREYFDPATPFSDSHSTLKFSSVKVIARNSYLQLLDSKFDFFVDVGNKVSDVCGEVYSNLSAVLKENQSSVSAVLSKSISWSRSVRNSSRVLVNSLFVALSSWRRSMENMSAELINSLLVTIDRSSWSRSSESLSVVLVNPPCTVILASRMASSGAILPPPTEMSEGGFVLREWTRQNAIRLELKDKTEKELLSQIIDEANEYKDEFYKKRLVSLETNKEQNRSSFKHLIMLISSSSDSPAVPVPAFDDGGSFVGYDPRLSAHLFAQSESAMDPVADDDSSFFTSVPVQYILPPPPISVAGSIADPIGFSAFSLGANERSFGDEFVASVNEEGSVAKMFDRVLEEEFSQNNRQALLIPFTFSSRSVLSLSVQILKWTINLWHFQNLRKRFAKDECINAGGPTDSDSSSFSKDDSDGHKASVLTEQDQACLGASIDRKGVNDLTDGGRVTSLFDQVEQSSQQKPNPSEFDEQQDGEISQNDRPASPERIYRPALLKNRFTDTILKILPIYKEVIFELIEMQMLSAADPGEILALMGPSGDAAKDVLNATKAVDEEDIVVGGNCIISTCNGVLSMQEQRCF